MECLETEESETCFSTTMQHNRIDPDSEAAIRRFTDLIARRYDIAGAIVYGSRARGTHLEDSDADVAILLNGARQRFSTIMLDMADTAFDVLLETGIDISPLPIWLDEWEHPESYSNPNLLQNIAREGIRL
jgi:predicted nucleotidyltransferase